MTPHIRLNHTPPATTSTPSTLPQGETESTVCESCGSYRFVDPPEPADPHGPVWFAIGVLSILASFAGVLLLGACVIHHFNR